MRKTLIASLALAGLVATPALAAKDANKPAVHKTVKHDKKAPKQKEGANK